MSLTFLVVINVDEVDSRGEKRLRGLQCIWEDPLDETSLQIYILNEDFEVTEILFPPALQQALERYLTGAERPTSATVMATHIYEMRTNRT